MAERKVTAAVVADRHQRARKKDKGLILDEFVKLNGGIAGGIHLMFL